MRDQTVDAVTRGAAEVLSRRGSLLTLSSAALALGLSGPSLTKAKKGKSNKCKKQVDRCKQGLEELCTAIFTDGAMRRDVQASSLTPETCFDLFKDCCQPLNGCNVAQAFDCAVQVIETR